MSTDASITYWIGRLTAGDAAAVRPLFDRYFRQLVELARSRLRHAPRRASDEEDVALSAFESFCRNAEAGRFPDLSDRDSLWRLLAAFTLRKAARHARDEARLKRGGGATVEAAGDHSGPDVLDQVVGREPDPALAAQVTEECQRLLAALGDPELRRVALLRMDGYSVKEVAHRIGLSARSVKRKLQLIRAVWEREAGDGTA